jgi:type VI secretion system secreted protein VgrG
VGKEISCFIELEGMGQYTPGQPGDSGMANRGAGVREINALITQARYVGQADRHALYELTLHPWLHLSTLRSDCKVFQNMTAIQVIESILGHYPFAATQRLLETYPERDYCVQYNETDFEFLSRLFEENGISYFFEHTGGVHRLVYTDHNGAYERVQKDNPQSPYETIPSYPPGHKIDREYIHQFSAVKKVTSGVFAARDYDYTQSNATLAATARDPRATEHALLERYLWRGNQPALVGADFSQPNAGANPQAHKTQNQGQQYARQRMDLLRQGGHRAQGTGHIRGIVPGYSFTLTGHPHAKMNMEYIVLHTKLTVENVAQQTQYNTPGTNTSTSTNNTPNTPSDPHALRVVSDADRLSGQWRVVTQFEVQPSRERLRPDCTQRKPNIGGMEPALVCGPSGGTAQSSIYTDAYGRIKVQFPWDRYGSKNENSSCWIRVSSHWAGNQLGSISTPRIGQEVLVGFMGGDPDLPIVTGSVYNQFNMPPWLLSSQQALTGIRSRELVDGLGNSASGRSNHVILDDTQEQMQVQIKSDHQTSQLSVGSITRIDSNQGRTEPRGEGVEVRSDAPGVVRTNGLLLTTHVRPNAQGSVKDMGETVQRLAHAQEQHAASAHTAQEFGAQNSQDQQRVASALEAQVQEIRGEGKGGETPFPELSQPHWVAASAAGIEMTALQSAHIAAGAHIALTSAEHTSISSGQSLLATAAQAVRIVAGQDGMNFIAIDGDINIKALEQSLNILAQLEITQTAETITIAAKKDLQLIGGTRVLINGGGSTSQWQGSGIVHKTNGQWTEYAANHGAPKALNMPLSPTQAQAPYSLQYRVKDVQGRVLAHTPYQLTSPSGKVVASGVTDVDGLTAKHYSLTKSSYSLRSFHALPKK